MAGNPALAEPEPVVLGCSSFPISLAKIMQRCVFLCGVKKKFLFTTKCIKMKTKENLCTILQVCGAYLAMVIIGWVVSHCQV